MADTATIMNRVRALLDKADSTEHAPEAAACRAKAEELMVKYRIEQEDVIAKDQFAILPVNYDIRLTGPSPYQTHYVTIFGNIAAHVGIRVMYEYDYSSGDRVVMARGVGYQSDVDYADLLFTQARMVFGERLEPKLDPTASDQVNVYRLRSSGMERVRIADLMWGNADKVFLSRVGRLYKAECAQRGEEPALSGRGVTGAAYREQYSLQFVYTLASRLRMARDSAGTGGGGLVLAGREERISEAFYTRFPDMRPKAAVEGGSTRASGQCVKCAKATSGSCREHPRGRSYSGGRDPYSAAAMRGRAGGEAAARAVNLGRGSGTGKIGA